MRPQVIEYANLKRVIIEHIELFQTLKAKLTIVILELAIAYWELLLITGDYWFILRAIDGY